jgi:Fe-S-cluster-containing dehydrogenase component/formate-dependent nitrite reductase membrane component NrfD
VTVAGDLDLRHHAAGDGEARPLRWGKVIDQTRCIGCHACTTACKSENEVPLSVSRTYVKYVDVGVFPEARRAFQVTRCNQCDDAPCVTACPTSAMFRRDDGIVDFDKAVCIGCKACIAACPYDAIFINPDDHSAEKCNFCAHRLDVGLEPACVVVCPTQAILVGDLDDPLSQVAQITRRESVAVRRPEKGTRPKLFYKGGTQATLDPLAARRPEGGLFLWSEQGAQVGGGTGRAGPAPTSSAAALLSYDVSHRAPWDWRVSLYTWTKGIAAGAYLAALVLTLSGLLEWGSSLWLWAAPVVGLGLLAATGGILIWDLEHPRRFLYLFLRPQWRSWLVRGAVAISAYGTVLAAHLLLSAAGLETPQKWLAIGGIPAAVAAAVYTGYLFAQAKARDLWQSPLLIPHLLAQALLLGSAVLLPLAQWLAAEAVGPLEWLLAGSALAHLVMAAGEASVTHGTAHARLAAHELTRGRYAPWFWTGAALVATALFAPLIGVAAVPLALLGLLAHEHAYVQAGQSVPLA